MTEEKAHKMHLMPGYCPACFHYNSVSKDNDSPCFDYKFTIQSGVFPGCRNYMFNCDFTALLEDVAWVARANFEMDLQYGKA